jgi:molybdate transport system permease protein
VFTIFRPHRTDHGSAWLFIAPSLALVALIALPVLALVWRSVDKDFLTYIVSPTSLRALRLSLVTSFISVGLALLTGTPLAYLLAHWTFRGRSVLDMLVDLPVVLPPAVAGIALLMAFGRMGLFGAALGAIGVSLPFTTTAVVLAQTFVSAPYLVRAAKIGFAAVDPQQLEAARLEGASEWEVFNHIMLPLAGRALLAGTVLAWTRALGEFGATLLFAGNLEGTTQTLPLAIYIGFEQDPRIALVLSTMLLAVSVLLLALLRRLEAQS